MSLGIQAGNVATQVTIMPLAAATSRATSWSLDVGIAVLGALSVVRLSTQRPPRPDDPATVGGLEADAAPVPPGLIAPP